MNVGFQRAAPHQVALSHNWRRYVQAAHGDPQKPQTQDTFSIPIPRHMPKRHIWLGGAPSHINQTDTLQGQWAVAGKIDFSLGGSVVFSSPFFAGRNVYSMQPDYETTFSLEGVPEIALSFGPRNDGLISAASGGEQPALWVHQMIDVVSYFGGAPVFPVTINISADLVNLAFTYIWCDDWAHAVAYGLSIMSCTESL